MARYLAEEVRIGIIASAYTPTGEKQFARVWDKFHNCPISITNGALVVTGNDSIFEDPANDYVWDVSGYVEQINGLWVTKYDTYISASVQISKGVTPVGGTGRYRIDMGTESFERYYDVPPTASGSGSYFDPVYLPATPCGSYAPESTYKQRGEVQENGCRFDYWPPDNFILFEYAYNTSSGQVLGGSLGDLVRYQFTCDVDGISLVSSKPSRDDPVSPTLTQVNRIYTRGRYAHVFYTYANIDYTEVLVKGDGPIWWALGDGYIKKALIFDRFAWVYIGSDKYLCRDLGQDLSLYG